jgi:glycosyltransferase involved in cell wall biosynthesis
MTRPLAFCFLTTFYPPYNFGGDGIGVQRLARALVRRGHRVTVVHDVDAYSALAPRTPAPAEAPEPAGLEVIPLRSGLGSLSPLLTQQTGRPIANGSRIRRILEDGRFDVVNFNNISLVGGPGLLSYGADALRIYLAHEHWLVCDTHVLWRHDREPCAGRECVRCVLSYKRPPQVWRYTGYLEQQLRQVDTFIAMSEFSRAKHRELGFPHDMEVLPYFLPDPDPEPAPPTPRPQERPYFLFVGRLEKIKGLDDVIPVFERYPDADLIIAGAGEHGAALRALAARNPRVRFVGRLGAAALDQYYQHALGLIVPSVGFETFGIILIESFKHGTPVLARRVGPFPEIVEAAGGGELFETPEQLVAAMQRLQGDPARRAALGRAAYDAYRARWTESAVVPRYLDIVARGLERRERTARGVAPVRSERDTGGRPDAHASRTYLPLH